MSDYLFADRNWRVPNCPRGEPGAFGLEERDWDNVPFGSQPEFSGPMPIPLIPESEWMDRIDEMERTKSSLTHIIDDAGVPCLDQGSVGYCHAFSLAHAAMCLRAAMNQPFRLLSASSVGGPVTGYRNQGAWILDDLKQAATVGFSEEKYYPMLTTQNKWTPDAKASAERNKVTHWFELRRGNMNEMMTALLSRFPVVIGVRGHAVNVLKPVIRNGKIAFLFQNSWKASWGCMGDGRALLSWELAVPQEAYSPAQMTPS